MCFPVGVEVDGVEDVDRVPHGSWPLGLAGPDTHFEPAAFAARQFFDITVFRI